MMVVKKMIKTIRVMLIPNNKQNTKLFRYANTARFAYNWALGREKENYKNGGKFLSDSDLRKEFTQLKKTEEYSWLNEVSNNVTKQAIKDACHAYKRFFKGCSKFPKFKSRKFSIPSFYQDNVKIQFSDTHVKIEGFAASKKKNKQKINWIRLAEKNRIPTDCNYSNPRIRYDGINWWITVGIEYEDSVTVPSNDGIGIDLGIKDLAICSDGNKYKNINKTKKVKKLEKQKRRLQRSISRSYENNKQGKEYCKTKNVIKKEKLLLILNHRLTNIRHDHLHHITSEIVKREPSFICIEDLNVKGMMKNRHLSKAVQQQGFYEFRRQMEYKSEWNNIQVIIADRFFPSSKLCSCCGKIKKDLKLSERIYKCECGNIIDRDLQAALNLKKYGEDSEEYISLYNKMVPQYDKEKFENKWKKLDETKPSHTLVAHLGKDTYSHIHPIEPRGITVREAARLQSFPDDFFFDCSMGDAFKQIGNAVPPLLAYGVAKTVLNTFEEE